jgi:hypothetical protein
MLTPHFTNKLWENSSIGLMDSWPIIAYMVKVVNGLDIEPQPFHMDVIMTHVDIWRELRVLVSCIQEKTVSN